MSKTKGYPHKQPFCVTPKQNKMKLNAWFQHAPYHNNRVQKEK